MSEGTTFWLAPRLATPPDLSLISGRATPGQLLHRLASTEAALEVLHRAMDLCPDVPPGEFGFLPSA